MFLNVICVHCLHCSKLSYSLTEWCSLVNLIITSFNCIVHSLHSSRDNKSTEHTKLEPCFLSDYQTNNFLCPRSVSLLYVHVLCQRSFGQSIITIAAKGLRICVVRYYKPWHLFVSFLNYNKTICIERCSQKYTHSCLNLLIHCNILNRAIAITLYPLKNENIKYPYSLVQKF